MSRPKNFSPEAGQWYADDLSELARWATALQGEAAFDCPRSAAAHHEAGHAVAYAAEGLVVSRVRVWSETRRDRACWLGWTDSPGIRTADAWSNPAEDLRWSRLLLAGVVSEALFEGADMRAGSSLDEIAQARAIVRIAAGKLGYDPTALVVQQFAIAAATLQRHRVVVAGIADLLMRRAEVRGAFLHRLLAPVRRLEDGR